MVQLAVCELLLLDYDYYNMFVRPIWILYRIANTSSDRYPLSTISMDFQIESPNSSAINGWPTYHMDNKWLEMKGNENTHLQLKYISVHSLDLRDIKTPSHCLPWIPARQRPSTAPPSTARPSTARPSTARPNLIENCRQYQLATRHNLFQPKHQQ